MGEMVPKNAEGFDFEEDARRRAGPPRTPKPTDPEVEELLKAPPEPAVKPPSESTYSQNPSSGLPAGVDHRDRDLEGVASVVYVDGRGRHVLLHKPGAQWRSKVSILAEPVVDFEEDHAASR